MSRADEPHGVAVAAVVRNDDGRVLAMRRSDHGNWEPPGGVLKLGEGIPDGVVREVREETGIVVEPGALTGVYKNMEEGVITLVFEATDHRGEIRTSDEASEVRWLTLDEVEELFNEAYARWVFDALGSDRPQVRSQEGTVKGASSSPG